MSKFITKRLQEKPIRRNFFYNSSKKNEYEEINKTNENKKNNVMNTKEKIEMANAALSNENEKTSFKRVKKDKGLIERTESSITVLTEDNKELLKD